MKPSDAKRPSRPDPISMRLPEELKVSLVDAAKTAGRSLNAEIRVRLEWSLERAPDLAGVIGAIAPIDQTTRLDQIDRRLADIEARLGIPVPGEAHGTFHQQAEMLKALAKKIK